jgi:hypothetical protein
LAAAFLPWEEWLARLVHNITVALKRRLYQMRRSRQLERSRNWAQAEGNVHTIEWDSSAPREEILYYYRTEQGYHSGRHWHWFDATNPRQVQAGDRIKLRYDPADNDKSVFLGFC